MNITYNRENGTTLIYDEGFVGTLYGGAPTFQGFVYGKAVCSPKDNFNKKTGQAYALQHIDEEAAQIASALVEGESYIGKKAGWITAKDALKLITKDWFIDTPDLDVRTIKRRHLEKVLLEL